MTHLIVSMITVGAFEFCFRCKVRSCVVLVFSAVAFFSLVSSVKVSMDTELFLVERKKNVVCNPWSSVCHPRSCYLVFAYVLLQVGSSYQDWKRHLFASKSECKEYSFYFFRRNHFRENIFREMFVF